MPKSVRQSDKNFICPIFGSPKDISVNVLPTFEDVLKCWLLENKNLKKQQNRKNPSACDIAELVSKKVESLWAKLLIPTVSHQRVKEVMLKYHEDYLKVKKKFNRNKDSLENSKDEIEKFKKDSTKLFDIAACKCESFRKCKCPKYKRVPFSERDFLVDQRSSRHLAIGSIDKVKTNELKRKLERNFIDSNRVKRHCNKNINYDNLAISSQQSTSENDPDSQELYQYKPTRNDRSSTQEKIEFKNVAAVCQRYGTSSRAAAAIATAALHDAKVFSKSEAVDKNKIRRDIEKLNENIKSESNEIDPLRGLYYDGRHDQTKVMVQEGSKHYPKVVTEDHYSLVQEPGSKYLSHITTDTSTAEDISNSIITCLTEEFPAALNTLQVVGCDGTVVNTGHKGGAILLLESSLNRPLQRFICLLHFNELPLRHLFIKLDGATTGPTSYSGPIGKKLQNCEQLPVVSFESIECSLPQIDSKILSTDQKYLFEISKAISSGDCSSDLARRHPGNICHSRWLTTANRILRLYISTENPSQNLKIIVEFILKVYVKSWFSIKIKSSVKDGAKHLFSFIRSSRYMSKKYLDIIDPVIQRNAFFAAPENILISMLTEEDQNIRRVALERILTAKNTNEEKSFEIPIINFNAANYMDMIDWTSCDVRAPPVLEELTANEIEEMLTTNNIPSNWDFTAYPCHTQAVERTVKLVTEASKKVFGKKKDMN